MFFSRNFRLANVFYTIFSISKKHYGVKSKMRLNQQLSTALLKQVKSIRLVTIRFHVWAPTTRNLNVVLALFQSHLLTANCLVWLASKLKQCYTYPWRKCNIVIAGGEEEPAVAHIFNYLFTQKVLIFSRH